MPSTSSWRKSSLPNAEDVDEIVEAVCADGGLEDFEDEVHELARRCLASPTVVRAIELRTYQREVPFTIPTDDDGFLTGRMDLVFHDGEDYMIVDYKTDAVDADDVQDHALAAHAAKRRHTQAGCRTSHSSSSSSRVVLVKRLSQLNARTANQPTSMSRRERLAPRPANSFHGFTPRSGRSANQRS